MLKLPALFNLKDSQLRDYFERIEHALNRSVILGGQWVFFSLKFSQAETNKKINHGLKFSPKDVIKTFETGAGTISFNYSEFNKSTIDITTTGACEVRFFLGRYEK